MAKIITPRYVLERDAVAERAGLQVSRKLDEEDGSHLIRTVWCGTSRQFRATGLFSSSFFPKLECFAYVVSLRDCRVKRPRDGIYTATWSDHEPAKIATYPGNRNIEIVWRAPDWHSDNNGQEIIELCGSGPDLVAERLLPQQRLPDKRYWKCGGSILAVEWRTTRLRSGAIKYEIKRHIETGFKPSYTLERARLLIAWANGERDPAFQRFLGKLPLDGVPAA